MSPNEIADFIKMGGASFEKSLMLFPDIVS